MSRKPVIAANWKMFKTRTEVRETCSRLLELVGDCREVEIVVCPPYTSLSTAHEVLRDTPIGLGAQNVHWEDSGAYTCQISLPMIIDCGCRYVILGHSECRQYLDESDERVNLRLKRVLSGTLLPIVCIGEDLEEREAGRVEQVVVGQLERALDGLTPQGLSRMIIAYEPVWAIGTGRTATPEAAQEVHLLIRNWLKEHRSPTLSGQIRILYGGSVKPGNIKELMAQNDIDGALVGGASLQAESFAKLVRYKDG